MPATSPKKLPDELVGRYALYKKGTRKLVTWITKTAGQTCDLRDHIKSLNDAAHLKTPHKRSTPTELDVRAIELLNLADAISKSETVEIPEDILMIAKDVIEGREQCAKWFGTQALEAGSKVEKENETHRFFIKILQKILSILSQARARLLPLKSQPSPSATSKSKKAAKQSDKTHDALGNLFARLKLEEPGPNPLGSAPLSATTNTSTGRPSNDVDFKLEKEDDDYAFALWCLLQDLADIRTYVKEMWEEYKRGDLTFMAATLLTDTAFGLLRRAEHDFAQTNRAGSTSVEWLEMIQYLGLDIFAHGHGVYLRPDPKRQTAEPRLPHSKVNIVELLSPIAYLCLRAYERDAADVCTLRSSSARPTRSQSTKDRVHEFQGMLFSLAGELDVFAHPEMRAGIQIGDSFIEGLAEIHLTTKVHVWMVAACEIYFSIYAILGKKNVSAGVKAIYDCSEIISKIIGDTDALSMYSKDPTETAGLRGILNVHGDLLSKLHLTTASEDANAFSRSGKEGSSALEGYLPVFAGTQLADMKLRMYDSATSVADHGNYILSAAHLYKNLRAEGALHAEWHDMAVVLAAFGKKQPLVTQSGKIYSSEQAWRRYMLATGFRLQDLPDGANPAASIDLKPKQPSRKVTSSSALLQALLNRANLKYNHHAAHARNEIVAAVLHGIADEDGSATSKSTINVRNGKSLQRQKYTPVQLLGATKSRLAQDEQFINFDFAGFAVSCKLLLDDLSSKLGSLVSFNGFDKDELHRDLVGRIIYYAGDNTMTRSIADFLRAHFDSQGNQEGI